MSTLSRADTGAAATARTDLDRGRDRTAQPRGAGIAAIVIGLGLTAAPFAFQMFSRAPKGATMLHDFRPFMTDARLAGFHADIAKIDAAVLEISAQHVPSSPSGSYRGFAEQWPTIHADMSDLLDNVTSNLGNYRAVAALPSFTLFPWFFVIPGVFIAVAGVLSLRPRTRRSARIALAALGIGLILAPAVFQMFTRAPKGGDMMTAFKDIETTQNVQKIQGYFSTMAIGQGAIRLEIVPALERSGRSAEQIATELPAVTELDRDWVHILNDMTPMIGAMSDNVPNYQAIAALPPFPLFPWFFVIPGVIVAGLAAVPIQRRRTASTHPSIQGAS
jgi:hypothetical protein